MTSPPKSPENRPLKPPSDFAERAFAASPAVRYVAVYLDGKLELAQRDGLSSASDSETDRYEELLVNPTVLTLLSQRGEIDCGGLRWVLIRYGNFFQFVVAVAGGHVSVALQPGEKVLDVVARLEGLLSA